MKRIFNVAGPCSPEKHYMLPAGARCPDISNLIDQEQYFVIHAARQSGKTTLLQELARELRLTGRYFALYCSLESIQEIREAEKGIPAVVRSIAAAVEFHPELANLPFNQEADYSDFNNVLRQCLSRFCAGLNKPLVVLFDEVDCLSNGTLIAFLRQLREGYINRSMIPFVHSIALVGMRSIRDYKARIREDQRSLGSASPFNIITKSLTLPNFKPEEIAQLCAQHTEQEGQIFPQEVLDRICHYTEGQPWLVNAIAREIVMEILHSDHSQGIQPEYVDQAVQNIILRRDTHIDSLLERLKEDRVRRVVEPMIIGASGRIDPLDDDVQYVFDLGLVRRREGSVEPANRIYSEVIIRMLSLRSQEDMREVKHPFVASRYLAGQRLDMRKLLGEFQSFWRENSEIWQKRYQYEEAAPHLILMAFLQNVMNERGRIHREYGTGRGRIDLCLELLGYRYPIELKIRYSEKTLEEGQQQLFQYLDTMGSDEGWLILFDRRESVPWDEKVFWRDVQAGKKVLHIVGC